MPITTETAKVYRAGGRRWFTFKAACRAEAKERLRQVCECSRGDHITPPYVCFYHRPERYVRMVPKLAYIVARAATDPLIAGGKT